MLEYLFIGNKLKQLSENIITQINQILKNNDKNLELRSLAIITVIYNNPSISIKEISNLLNISHPAVVQIINKLKKNNIVFLHKDKADQRITLTGLTEKGKAEFEKLFPLLNDIDTVITELNNASNLDIVDITTTLYRVFFPDSIKKSFEQLNEENFLNKVKIITFNKIYRDDFRRLNYEWLNKYFQIEDYDKKILSNPEKEIINKGGEIFFALYNDRVVGTCAVIRINKTTYELAKMAVTKSFQGKGIGRKLLLTAIGYAATKKADKLVLWTNKKLIAANVLYKSIGFTESGEQKDNRYNRELIYMEFSLK